MFDHRQPRDGNFANIRPSKTIIEAGFAYVTIASRANDWFLSPSLSDCQNALSDHMTQYRRVTGFGSSMGGYGALALSRACRFNQVLLVSPQRTVFPDHPPFDPRFAEPAKSLDPTFDTVGIAPRKGLGGVVLFDPFEAYDLAHVRLILDLFPRLKPVPFPFAGHPALRSVAKARKFHRVQNELIADNISAKRLLQLYKSLRRKSPVYLEALAGRLEQRAQDRGPR